MEEKFARRRFDQSSSLERLILSRELAAFAESRLRGAEEFNICCYRIIEELRLLGHDIWSFDEGEDFQSWGPNYKDGVARGLTVRFTAGGAVEVDWVDD